MGLLRLDTLSNRIHLLKRSASTLMNSVEISFSTDMSNSLGSRPGAMQVPDLSRTALLLIDIQAGFDNSTYWGMQRSNIHFESNIRHLLSTFRSLADEKASSATSFKTTGPWIIHVKHSSSSQQSPLFPGKAGHEFHACALPRLSEVVLTKKTNSAFVSTNLEEVLRSKHVDTLYVAGLVVDHCVSTTIRMASDLGVANSLDVDGNVVKGRVVMVSDATATWERGSFDAETVHGVHVESLKAEFCEVLTTFEVVRDVKGD